MKKIYSLVLLGGAFMATQAQAAGFEKNVVWSGKYVGLGGAATSSVVGSESLYFNPAGLAVGNEKGDVSLNLSPTFGHYSGPLVSGAVIEESDKAFSPVGGLTAAYHLNEKLGFGAGFYVSGGTKAVFEDANLKAATGASALQLSPKIQSALSITEFALGAGYELIPGLKIGAAWRIVRVSGEFYSATAGTTPAANFAYVKIDNLKATRYDGFRAGVQYEPESKSWGVGASFRNNVDFDGKGTSSGQFALFSGAAPSTLTGGDTVLSSSFPWQAGLGGHFGIVDHLRTFLEFTHTNYSRIASLQIAGTLTSVLGTSRIPSVATSWRDQNNFRLGFEYTGLSALALRAGYVYTTKVVPNQLARAAFSSPGAGHTVALGAGSAIMADKLELNGAFEYSFAKGQGALPAVSGPYRSHAYAAHLGTTYKF